jgi:DNA repair exonuclease SbcCD ATPase subunit
LENRLKAYEYYLESIKRDGIPYELISDALPYIEEAVNETLSQIVEFTISFETDGKNILTYIKYDKSLWPLEMTSGMEKFISSLAIRVALINVSNLPRPNFLAIDEGFGNLDSDNLNSMFMLFEYLKSEFEFILVISHLDALKDAADGLFEINTHKDFSKITF